MKTVQDFFDSTCELAHRNGANDVQIFPSLLAATNGDPCTTGCAYFKNGNCHAYRTLFPGRQLVIVNRVISALKKNASRPSRETVGYARPTKKPFKW